MRPFAKSVRYCTIATFLGAILLSAIEGPSPAVAQQSEVTQQSDTVLVAPPSATEVQGWIEQLGAPTYEQRQLASHALLNAGRTVLNQLRNAAQSEDMEINLRRQRIVAAIEARIIQERRAAFLNSENPLDSAPPGWEEFCKLVADTPENREFFLAMYEAEPETMDALSDPPDERLQQLKFRAEQLYTQITNQQRAGVRNLLSSINLAALFFVSSQELPPDSAAVQRVTQLINYSDLRAQMASSQQRNTHRTLLTSYITKQLGADRESVEYHAATLLPFALTFGIHEILPLAEQLLVDTNAEGATGRNATAALYAAITIGRFGGKQHLDILKKTISDDRSCWSWQANDERRNTQVGDVALVMSLHLLGEDPKNYNFDRLATSAEYIFQPYTMSFVDDVQRKKSRDAWEIFLKTGKTPPPEETSNDPPANDNKSDDKSADQDNAAGKQNAKKDGLPWPLANSPGNCCSETPSATQAEFSATFTQSAGNPITFAP